MNKKTNYCFYLNTIQLILIFILIMVQICITDSIFISNIIIGIQAAIFILIISVQGFYCDLSVILLSFLCLGILVTNCFVEDSNYFLGNYYSFLISFVGLVVGKNIKIINLDKKVIKLIVVLSIAIVIFAISKFVELYNSNIKFSGLYKYLFELPYGKSNALGMWYISCLCILYDYRKNNLCKILIGLLTFSTVILYSRSAILIFLLMILFKSRNKKKIIRNIALIALVVVCIYMIEPKLFRKIFVGVNEWRYNNITLDNLSSGRLSMYKEILGDINIKYILVGRGLGNIIYNTLVIRAHNILLDVYASSGLVNLIIFCALISVTLFKLKKNSVKDKLRYNIYIIFILTFIQSQIEPVLFSNFKISVYIWFLVGISLSNYTVQTKKEVKNG